jgi:excinuclease UvrABC nuclease subunit
MPPKIPASVQDVIAAAGTKGVWAELQCDPVFCGVYILLSGDEPVYVGQSIDVLARCRSHVRRRRSKEFDRIVYFACDELDLDPLEAALIIALRPKYNSHAYPTRGRRKHITERRRLLAEARKRGNV